MSCSSKSKRPQFNKFPKYVNERSIQRLFGKKFAYKKSNWQLPPISLLFSEPYKIDELQVLKLRLNYVKSKLNDYPIEEWSAHTGRRNAAGNIAGFLKNRVKAEFVTQAWCKFYECLHQYPLVQNSNLFSLHLCEAPGAFIAALNHYLHSTYNSIQWVWLSTTLNPYYEGNALSKMVTDDRFILHTIDRWTFGEDFTGNIMNKANVAYIKKEAENIAPVDLITADGSIDCMEDPAHQEEIVYALHFAEVCAALSILSEGGSFIIKMFTMFESSSICLMYLLNCVFEAVNVYKPATSKSGNSEVYVICLGFSKTTKNFVYILDILLEKLNSSETLTLFPLDCLPEDFIVQHEECVKYFTDQQIEVIESNIQHFENQREQDLKYCQVLRKIVCDKYLKTYKIKELPQELTILFNRDATVHYETHKKVYTGSYTERSLLKSLPFSAQIIELTKQLECLKTTVNCSQNIVENMGIYPKSELQIKLYFGKPIVQVYSSLFSDLHIMHLRGKILSIGANVTSICANKSRIYVSCSSTQAFKEIIPVRTGHCIRDEKFLCQNLIELCLALHADKLVFKNVLFLTHFSVSILIYLWSNVFQELIICTRGDVVLQNLKDHGIAKLKYLRTVMQEENFDRVLLLVNIQELHNNYFSSIIQRYNNVNLLLRCQEELNTILHESNKELP